MKALSMIFTAAVLCAVLSGCGGNTVSPASSALESSSVVVSSTSLPESSAASVSSASRSEPSAASVSSTSSSQEISSGDGVDGQSTETSKADAAPGEKPYFTKVALGAIKNNAGEMIYGGVYALDSIGDLYYISKEKEVILVEQQIRDFSRSAHASILWMLKENGDVFVNDYDANEGPKLLYQEPDAQKISDNTLILSDGSVIRYTYDKKSLFGDISAQKVDGGSLAIDENHVLWYSDSSTNELTKIADNVVDCSYAPGSKNHYTSGIWYVTQDYSLYLRELNTMDAAAAWGNPILLQKDVKSIKALAGRYLVQKLDNTYFYGVPKDAQSESFDINVEGIGSDLTWTEYAILDNHHEIHLGEMKKEEFDRFVFFRETVLSHP